MSVFDHPIVSSRYFFPRSGAPQQGIYPVAVDGATLQCARFERDPRWPWIIYFHGNGEIVADYIPSFVHFFHQMGANCFFAEYRGYGGSSGEPLLAKMLEDARTVVDSCGVEPHRQIIFGRSVGSIYAIDVASKRDVAGLIVESGIADVLQRILLRAEPSELQTTLDRLTQEANTLFDHRAKLAQLSCPALFLHTQFDHLVDVSHAELNHQWTGHPDKSLVSFTQGDHNSIFAANQLAYTEHVQSFVQKCARIIDALGK